MKIFSVISNTYYFCFDVSIRPERQTASACLMAHEHMVVRIAYEILDMVAKLDVTGFKFYIKHGFNVRCDG